MPKLGDGIPTFDELKKKFKTDAEKLG